MKSSRKVVAILSFPSLLLADIGNDIVVKANSYKPRSTDCYAAAYEVVEAVYSQHGVKLQTINSNTQKFAVLWGTNPNWQSQKSLEQYWLLPELSTYRASGPPGAMADAGYGTVVSNTDIWRGKLTPGALIQAWDSVATFKSLHKGIKPAEYHGHAFIFLGYVFDEADDARIVGMRVFDHTSPPSRVFKKDKYGLWIGCNLKID